MARRPQTTLWGREIPPTIPAVLAVALVVALNAAAVSQVGFLSDDLVQLEIASRISWWEPITGHHLSPLLTLLYQQAERGALSVELWHITVLGFHLLNAGLVYRIAKHGFGGGSLLASASSLLYSTAPAGIEAVLWPAASCFVPLSTVLLLSFERLLKALQTDSVPGWPVRGGLALLQLLAFAIWDWAIVLAPILMATAMVNPTLREQGPTLRERSRTLLPTAMVWGLCILLRSLRGVQLGYGLFPVGFLKANALLVAAPGMILFPQLPGLAALGLSLACLIPLCWGALEDRRVRASMLGFYLLQLPWYFQGAPTSRYAYLAAPFLWLALVLVLRRLLPPRAALAAMGALLLFQGGWYLERAGWWIEASIQAAALGQQLEATSTLIAPGRELVVVNLPDHYGGARGQWPPPLWRNGLSVVRPNAAKVFTPDHAARFKPHAPVILERRDIAAAYPDAALFEVTHSFERGEERYDVVPFRSTP